MTETEITSGRDSNRRSEVTDDLERPAGRVSGRGGLRLRILGRAIALGVTGGGILGAVYMAALFGFTTDNTAAGSDLIAEWAFVGAVIGAPVSNAS